ncbi:Tetratricopeptide repeat-containing protein [Saccharicrinis carchari]|uniref:Tetratricopeptide repeat-containing protein n=2 Tax=Saccharicrinis carchari TaxID=1168039 RepID=A0A521AV14_SACCC|nr:Tetratricopeptide repeat-containing protein [Saccharicrinis carchari]
MMKKTVLFLAALFTISIAVAQKGKVTTATTLLEQGDPVKAKEAIDQAMEHEKSNTWPKTYIVAAKVYTKLYQKGKDDKGTIKAYKFYQKAIELDKKGNHKGKQKGKYKKEIGQALLFFGTELTNAGVEAFNKEDFETAVLAFDGLLELNKNEYMEEIQGEKVDTAIIFNAALAAYNAKNWSVAEDYFNQSIDLKYGGGDAVLLVHQMYVEQGDSTNMGSNLMRGFETYPEDNRILTELINYYLNTKQNDKALDYLNKAIESDATNASYYYARGVLYDSNKDFEAAKADYQKALEYDPEYFNALYNLGVMYFNKAVEEMNLANAETDFKKFESKKKVAETTFKEAMPYFERALEVKPDEVAVLESLKTLYYRFEMMDKYKEVDEKLKSL